MHFEVHLRHTNIINAIFFSILKSAKSNYQGVILLVRGVNLLIRINPWNNTLLTLAVTCSSFDIIGSH